MHDMVTAVAGSGVSPIIRILGPSGTLIKRALDTGAQWVLSTPHFFRCIGNRAETTPFSSGILVPMINTAAEARSVVSFAKFPPVGVRGQGSPFACLEQGLATPSEYVAKANESLITMVQIETVAAVNNIEEICQVDGVGKSSLFCKGGWNWQSSPRPCLHRTEWSCVIPARLYASEVHRDCLPRSYW